MDSNQRTVAAAQGALSVVVPELMATGRWNTFTSDAYTGANPQIRTAVDRILVAGGLEAKALIARAVANKASMSNFIPISSVNEMIGRACGILGVEDLIPAVTSFVAMESRVVNGMVKFDQVNGSSMGIFQMQKGAWSDAGKILDQRGVAHQRSFEDGVFDPWENVLKGVAYTLINARTLRNKGVPITSENLYLAHNQGAGFFTRNQVTAFDRQSGKARDMIRKSIQQRGVTPKFVGSHASY